MIEGNFMINNDYRVSFKGLNLSKISSNDMKWLQNKQWWPENLKEISEISKKYDIEIISSSQNIGASIPHNVSVLEVIARPLGSKKSLFGSKVGSAVFDTELYDVLKHRDKTLLETVKKAVSDIRFMIFQ